MDKEPSLDERLAKISRDLFINRCLLGFIAVCVGIMLFLPGLAAGIAEVGDRLYQASDPYLVPVVGALLGIGAVVGVTAFVVSQVYPSPPQPKGSAEH